MTDSPLGTTVLGYPRIGPNRELPISGTDRAAYSDFGDVLDAIDALDADVTTVETTRSTMELVAQWVPKERLWAHPDRGLKTRSEAEVIETLRNLVAAANAVR